jgi:hypothetical protein
MALERMDIISGPSKFDFLETISFRKAPKQTVTFEIVQAGNLTKIELWISTITAYDDPKVNEKDGHEWFFIGHIDMIESVRPDMRLRGKYSTRTRKGWVEVLPYEIDVLLNKLLRGKK